jgi:hypothetical protein
MLAGGFSTVGFAFCDDEKFSAVATGLEKIARIEGQI